MTFERLRLADWVALVTALALLFVMAMDWYSTVQGREARRIEQLSDPQGALGGEVERQVEERARERAEGTERNAWQADAAIDRIALVALLAVVGLSVLAAFLRAAGRRFEPPWTPSGLAAIAAVAAALLVTYRMVQQPGEDAGATVEAGAPIALALLGVIGAAAATALRAEDAGRAFREPAAPEPADEDAAKEPS